MFTTIFGSNTRTIQRRSELTLLSDPDDWLVDAMGGTSATGESVTFDSAMRFPAVFRAVSLVSRDLARLGCHLYRRVGEGKERDVRHPVYQLLRYRPSAAQTAFQFFQVLQLRAMLRGNGYAWIVRSGVGDIEELLPLSEETEAFRVQENGKIGPVLYKTRVGGEEKILLPRDVLHVAGVGDGLNGYSVIRLARETFGMGLASQKYGAKFFANGGRIGLALEHPGELKEEAAQRILDSYMEKHGTLDQSHRPLILEEGMKANPFAMSNEDAQYLGTREFEDRQVGLWFGIPPHKMGDSSRTSYNSLEQENQSYLDEAVEPWLACWESELREKILDEGEREQDSHVVEFNRFTLAKANMEARGEFYTKAIASGWMSRDEVRARENMNPIPDGSGKVFLVPLNMGESGGDAEGDKENGRGVRESLEALLRGQAGRVARRISKRFERSKEWAPHLGTLYENEREPFLQYMDEAVAAYREAGADIGYTKDIWRDACSCVIEVLEAMENGDRSDLAARVEAAVIRAIGLEE